MNSIQKGDFARRLYRGEGSVRLEEEIILPDYCADITRLVKSEALPIVEKSRAYFQDGILCVDVSGRAELCFVYTDGETCESYRSTHPFSHTFKKDIGKNSRVSPDSISVCIAPLSSNASPRVMSARKLLSRCEITLLCEVFGNLEYSAYDPCDDISSGRVDVDRREHCIARAVTAKKADFSLVQEMKLPPSLPSCARVIYTSAVISVDSVHPDTDAMTCFMTVNFNVLYLSEEGESGGGELVSFYQPVEVREVLECDDCAEDSVCRVRAVAGVGESRILSDSFGENRVLSLEVPYSLYANVFENVETSFLTDAYGVGCRAECECTREDFVRFAGSLSENVTFRERLMLKTDAAELCGAEANVILKSTSVNGNEALADITLELSAVSVVDSFPDRSVNESVDMRIPLKLPDSLTAKISSENLVIDATVIPVSVDVEASSGAMELSGELLCQAQVWERVPVEFVSSVSFEEGDVPTSKTVFYYPSSEDTLWSVGRRYGVSRERLKKMNGMDNDELPAVCRIEY